MAESTGEQQMTENERNSDMLSSLNINSIPSDPAPVGPRPEVPRDCQKRIYEQAGGSSLQTQGIPASYPSGLSFDMTPLSNMETITMRNVCKGIDVAHYSFVERLRAIEMNSDTNVGRLPVRKPVKYESVKDLKKRIYEQGGSSLQTQGIPASHPSRLSYNITPLSNMEKITMRNAYKGDDEAHFSFLERLRGIEMNSDTNVGRLPAQDPVNLESFKLESKNVAKFVAKFVPLELTVIRFLPIWYPTVVVAGSRCGYLSVWEAPSGDADELGKVHRYQPHSSTVKGISVHPFFPTKIYSCCGAGHLRMMNIEWGEFDHIYSTSSGSAIYSLSQPPNDANSVYIGEGSGDLNLYDGRAGMIANSWSLHKGRINSIDFSPLNTNVLASASSDGLVCLWDLRNMDYQYSECSAFKAYTGERSICSAYFSPSGSCLAITSAIHTVAVLEGADFEKKHILHRGHLKNTPLSCSRAIWGWDDTYLYMGCQQRRVEVLSVPERKTTATLKSPLISSVPEQFDAHPFKVGMLVGASLGKAFLWTNSDYYY